MKPTIHIHINTPIVRTRDVEWSARHTGNFNFEVTTPKGRKILIGRAQNSTEAIEKAKKLPEGNTHDSLSLAEAERELRNEIRLIEVFKKSGKPVPVELIQRKKMLEEEVDRAKVKFGDEVVKGQGDLHGSGTRFTILSQWESEAKSQGLVVRKASHPSGRSIPYFTAKDKEGNHRGQFAGTPNQTGDAFSNYPSFESMKSDLAETKSRLAKSMRMPESDPYRRRNIERLRHEIGALEEAIAGKTKEEARRKKSGDAIGETFPTLAAAKAKVESLADKGIRAKVNQEVDEATKKMYFVVVRL
jgi:hypothetical protein